MSSPEYRRWVALGRPFTLAKPISTLFSWANAAGVPVLGTIGNEDHLTADRPQDHTPYSYTAWPVVLPGYIVTAIDLRDGPHSDVLLADARAGRAPWIKYLNFRGRQYSVKNGWSPVANADQHLHVSIRTDFLHHTPNSNPFTTGALDMSMTPTESQNLTNVSSWFLAYLQGKVTGDWPHSTGPLPELIPNKRLLAVEAAIAAQGVKLDAILTLLQGMGSAAGGAPTADEVRTIVDEELDEHSRAGADTD